MGGGLRVGERAVFAAAAGGENVRRAAIGTHGGHRVVGAAAAQNQHSAAPEPDAVVGRQIGKARVVGVVAVELTSPVHHRVHRADFFRQWVHRVAVGNDQLLVGDGHVDGLEAPGFQKRPGLLLGGQRVQFIGVAAHRLMDGLGKAVPQHGADQTVFHLYYLFICPSVPKRCVYRSSTPKAVSVVCTMAARGTMQGSWRP